MKCNKVKVLVINGECPKQNILIEVLMRHLDITIIQVKMKELMALDMFHHQRQTIYTNYMMH